MTLPKLYLAGPDVFRKDSQSFFLWAQQTCRVCGFEAICPSDGDGTSENIFRNNLKRIQEADLLLANLNPFRGVEPDSGTVWEVAYAYGLGKSAFAYMTRGGSLATRVEKLYPPLSRNGGLFDRDGHAVENFGLPLNLMLQHSLDGVFFGSLEAALASIMRVGWRP